MPPRGSAAEGESTRAVAWGMLRPMASTLETFIAHARDKGMDHTTIRMLLLSAGWKEKDVAKALSAQSLDMPVPVPPDAGGARDAFFHLLTFACLYAGIISLTILFFTYINRLFPDAAMESYVYDDLSGVRWSLAVLIITYPLFLFISRKVLREIALHPEKAWTGVRRWLTYLTLFVAAMVLVGDGVTLLYNLLQGELTLRFILKVLVVLILSGSSFTYYFLALRTDPPPAA